MILNFRQVAASDGPVEFHKAVDVSHVVKGRNDISGVEPLQVDLKAQPVGDGVVAVYGHLTTKLDMSCSRCLKPLNRKVDIKFNESFKQSEEPEAVSLDEDEDLQIVTEERVDLVPYVEESFLLSLPFAAVCSDSCKGLCPNCGTDLNVEQCGCDTEVIDPRLAGLKDFFK
ncbi:hypothetical protein D3C76_1086120 [compost metagenome]